MNTSARAKQFLELHGKHVIIYTLEYFEKFTYSLTLQYIHHIVKRSLNRIKKHSVTHRGQVKRRVADWQGK